MKELTYAEIYTWLQNQKYQTDHGEQGYMMYFDVDMPRIIRDAIHYFSGHVSELRYEIIKRDGIIKENARISELYEASKQLAHLHSCEEEGLLSGRPTPQMWRDATSKLYQILNQIEKEK